MGRRPLEPKSQHVPQRPDAILPVYLLSLSVGSAEIVNPHLVDAPSPGQRDLGADLDLETEIVAGDVQTIFHLAREHLVADLDVSERLVVEDVEQKRDQPVAEI